MIDSVFKIIIIKKIFLDIIYSKNTENIVNGQIAKPMLTSKSVFIKVN